MIYKILIHSMVDLITNSSTTIFTYQDSIQEAKELVQEILNLLDITDKKPDDIFYYGVFCEEWRYYENEDYCPEDIQDVETVLGLIESILKGEIEKPEWMKKVEKEESWSVYHPDTYLHLTEKEEKYRPLAQKILKFLNSPSHKGCYDG